MSNLLRTFIYVIILLLEKKEGVDGMRTVNSNLNTLNLYIGKFEYLKFSEAEIRKLKFHLSNLQFLINKIPEVIKHKRKKLEKLISEIEDELNIKLDIEKIEKIIKNERSKKDGRVEILINYLENRFREKIQLELELKENLEIQLKKVNEKLCDPNTPEKLLPVLKQKEKEIKLKLKLMENEKRYENFRLEEFFRFIKNNEEKIKKIVGLIMQIDILEKSLDKHQEKYDYIVTVLNDIYNNL